MATRPRHKGRVSLGGASALAGRIVRPVAPRQQINVPKQNSLQAKIKLPDHILRKQLLGQDLRKHLVFKKHTFTRNQLKVPLRKAGALASTTRFEMPDRTIGYLPEYRLATHLVGSKQQYRMSVRAEGTGAIVEFFLEAMPPGELDIDSAEVAVPHQINVAMTYVPATAGVMRTLDVQISASGSFQRGTLSLSSLEQVDELINALTNQRSGAAIQIIRSLNNAVPIKSKKTTTNKPGLVINLKKPIPVSSFARVDGGRMQLIGESANTQRYQVIKSSLEQKVALAFDSDRHSYIFNDFAARPTGTGRAFIKHLLEGDHQPYFQDPINLGLFYYLPDRYELSRMGFDNADPQLSITAIGESENVSLGFTAIPFVERARLDKATQLLAPMAGGREVSLQPAPFVDWTYKLNLPFEEPALREKVAAPGSLGFTDTVIVTRQQLAVIWDCLTGNRPPLEFSGSIEVKLSDFSVAIPFNPRLSDIGGGSLFEVTVNDAPEGALILRLTNAIESPVKIDDLGCAFLDNNAPVGSEPVPLSLEGLVPGTVLQPEETLELVCTPATVDSINSSMEVLLDISDIEIQPELDGVLEIIMDPLIVETAFSTQFFVFFSSATPGTEPIDPDSEALSVTVELEHGQSFTLKRLPPSEGPPEMKVTIQRSLADALLGIPAQRSVAYHYSVLRKGWLDNPVHEVATTGQVSINVPASAARPVDDPASA